MTQQEHKLMIVLVAEELQLLRIKYERLIQLSKTLLAPWPVQQATPPIGLQTAPSCDTHSQSAVTKTDNESVLPHTVISSDIQQIDKILAVAEKVRVHNMTTPSYQKSVQRSKSVYGCGPVKPSDRKPKNGKNHSTPLATDGVAMDTSKHIRCTTSLSSCPQPVVADVKQSFTLRHDGKSLVLPGRYRRLKNIMTKFNEHFRVCDECLKKEKEVFLQSIMASTKKKEDDIYLYLLKEELLLLQDTLSTLSPHVLSVTELEDIAKSKIQMETLFGSIDRVLHVELPVPKHTLSSLPLFENQSTSESCKLELMKLYLEKEFLSLCTSHLLPLLQSLDPADQRYPLLIQAIQNIAGLDKTVLVSVDTNVP